MTSSNKVRQQHMMIGMGISLLLLFIMVTFISQTIAASGLAADLESSEKSVDLAEAEAGETVQYTVLLSNTGNLSATNVFMMDTLPAEAIYESGSLTVTAGSEYVTAVYGENNGVITWTGTLSAQGYIVLNFAAVLSDTLAPGVAVTNTAVITGTGSWLTRTASTTITEPATPLIFMPIIYKPIPVPTLQLSDPVNNSQWTASWSNVGSGFSYELQESNDPDFANSITYVLGAGVTSQSITNNTPNIYYYRVRSLINGNPSAWSNTRSVFVGQLTLSLSRVNEFNQWSAEWTNGGSGVSDYELQEAKSQEFTSPQSYTVQSAQSYAFNHPDSPDNYYCYRVRSIAEGALGAWSNVACLAGSYFDDFSDDSTNWAIRRQDTDDVDNLSYYQEYEGENFFVLEIDGRWDYGIASPLRQAPQPPYIIQSKVRFNEPDNLNSYGFIFGADWDGTSECPNVNFSACFKHYYRLLILTNGNTEYLHVELKRIDRHRGANVGGGETLYGFNDIYVGPPAIGFKTWRIVVSADGRIEVFVHGNRIINVVDTTYIHNPYFGVFAASNEYLGAEPWYDYYSVKPLPEE